MSLNSSPDHAIEICQDLMRSHYENFSIASRLLPKELRPHMATVYAFCRTVDDIGDEYEGDRPAALSAWEEDFKRCYSGSPEHPILKGLQWTIRTHDIPPEPFLQLIEANRRDQSRQTYNTFDELLTYCTLSANPVGRLVLYLFGYRDERRMQLADFTCTGLQLANFFQDVAVDLEKGRVYLPLEDMARFGYSLDDLRSHTYNESFQQLMQFQVDRCREYFEIGLELPSLLRGRFRVDIRLFSLGGLAILQALERNRFDVFTKRPTVSSLRKVQLFGRALFREFTNHVASWQQAPNNRSIKE